MEIKEGQTVGIDLGTTYSALAQLDPEGNPTSIKNADGKTITPSVVLLGDDGKVIVGPTFERMSLEDPSHIVEAIKRQMGNKDFFVVYQNKKLTPEFISALILKKLKQDAEATIGPITNAVLTVPYYFNDVRRKATQDAGRIAGINVIDIINEPTAATLAYAWQRGELGRQDIGNKERTILVYDLGGGTFDVTVVRYTPTSFRVLATDGDVMLGGLDWSRRVVDHIAEQFHRKFNEDPRENPESMMTLTQECEDAKRDLSNKAQVPVNCYYKGKNLTVALTRGDFEKMTSDLMQRTRDTTELVMQQAGMKKGELDEVVLVGGSTHMPVVEAMLKDVTGREPSRDVIPEEAVAQGACIHAAILEARATGGDTRLGRAIINRLRAVNTTDVNSHSLGVKITDPNDRSRKINHIMVPKNTAVPHKVTQRFATNSQNQQRVHICVLEGEASDPDACTTIGDFRVVNLPPNLPAGSPVEVTYEYDKNGRIGAHARELTGNAEAQIEIDRAQGLDTEGVSVFEQLASQYEVE
ncbi:MAG: Hsp70 family protein [Planctomycetota bacterium]|nr:MAG: Hsp70 family protein [Planctomycetota bacterium]REJ93376.1 MAG: Hsp70 family protein [Planctomycetota bacterium]REK20753.1 MAG: Hsp70 family protein [Planctomycetota bacterium]REK38065.1 MAG: Hsp70 family protein [Planctomycetota bacterium]